jgi:hypothetical protein
VVHLAVVVETQLLLQEVPQVGALVEMLILWRIQMVVLLFPLMLKVEMEQQVALVRLPLLVCLL